jgi:hypothetical protein
MPDVAGQIESARAMVDAEIYRLGRNDLTTALEHDGALLAILIGKEARTIWIGYMPNRGFYLTLDLDRAPERFFELSNRSIREMVRGLPSATEDKDAISDDLKVAYDQLESIQRHIDGLPDADAASAGAADELTAAVLSEDPDSSQVSRIVDALPASDEGVEALAFAATLRSYRAALRRLRGLLDSQDVEHHREDAYRSLVAENSWMLGSYFDEVVFKEKQIWLDSRVDMVVQNATGYVEIVEFKRPDMPLLVRSGRLASLLRGMWRSSSELSDAWAQAGRYIDHLDENRTAIQGYFSIGRHSTTRLYRSNVLLVAGRSPSDPDALDTLRGMGSQSRIVVWTYDDLVAVAERIMRLFEKRIDDRVHLELGPTGAKAT